MDAIKSRAIKIIKMGRTPMLITGVEFGFLADWVCEYCMSGYVCGLIGSHESRFKQPKIQKTTNGERYIVADKKRFWVDPIKPFKVSNALLEKELAECISLRDMFIQMKSDGVDVGYNIENQEFYINNIQMFLMDVEKVV